MDEAVKLCAELGGENSSVLFSPDFPVSDVPTATPNAENLLKTLFVFEEFK
ncbi:MAG: hypothetical protein ACLUKN_01050 [Bacilli bacterium]